MRRRHVGMLLVLLWSAAAFVFTACSGQGGQGQGNLDCDGPCVKKKLCDHVRQCHSLCIGDRKCLDDCWGEKQCHSYCKGDLKCINYCKNPCDIPVEPAQEPAQPDAAVEQSAPDAAVEPQPDVTDPTDAGPGDQGNNEPPRETEPTDTTPVDQPPADDTPQTCIPYVRGAILSMQGGATELQRSAWSPSGDYYAAVTRGGMIRIWETQTGIVRETFREQDGQVLRLAFAPDGKALFTAGNNGAVSRWEGSNKTKVFQAPGRADVVWGLDTGSLKVGVDARPVMVVGYQKAAGGGAIAWHSLDGKLTVGTQKGFFAAVRAVALSPNAEQTAVGLDDGTLLLYETQTGKSLARVNAAHGQPIHTIAWMPDGSMFATGAADKTIKIWRMQNAQLSSVQTLGGHSQRVVSLSFSSDGKRLASSSSSAQEPSHGEVKIWNTEALATGGQIQELLPYTFGATHGAMSVAWHPDVSKLYKVLVGNPSGRVTAIVSDGLPRLMWSHHYVGEPVTAPLASFALHRNDGGFALGTTKGEIFYRSGVKGDIYKKRELGSPVTRVAWYPDGMKMVALTQNGGVHTWDPMGTHSSSHTPRQNAPTEIAIRRDGNGTLIGYEDGTLLLLKVADLTKTLATWSNLHSSAIKAIHWSHNGDLFATASQDGAIKVWKYHGAAQAPTLVKALQGPQGHIPGKIRFNHDDTILAVGMTGGKLGFWQRYTDKWSVYSSAYGTAVLSWQRLGGSFLVTAGWSDSASDARNQVVHLWDLTGAQPRLAYTLKSVGNKVGHTKAITALQVNMNNQTVLSTGLDGSISFWLLRRAYAVSGVSLPTLPVSVAVRPDGKKIAVGTSESSVFFWELPDNKTPTAKIVTPHRQSVNRLVLTKEGDRLLTGALDGSFLLWDLKQDPPVILQTYPGTQATFVPVPVIQGLDINAAQDTVLIGAHSTDRLDYYTGQMAFWSLNDATKPVQVFDKLPRVLTLAWNRTQNLVLSAHQFGEIFAWKKVNGAWAKTKTYDRFHQPQTTKLVVEQGKGEIAASVGQYGDIRVWRIQDGALLHRFDSGGAAVSAVQFHPAGHALAASLSNGQVKIWSLQDGRLLRLLVEPNLLGASNITRAHNGSVTSMAWSIDGNTLFTTGSDFKVREWRCTGP